MLRVKLLTSHKSKISPTFVVGVVATDMNEKLHYRAFSLVAHDRFSFLPEYQDGA
jgi:hypothetical protein